MEDQNKKPGIAIDIDDTLSDTLRHFIKRVQGKFGNPENLSAEEIAEKYGRMVDIPYWQTPEIRGWLDGEAVKNEAQEAIEVMPGALEAVRKINEIMPVRMYITSRPSIVEDGTKLWLRKNGFPEADLVTRPESKMKIDGNAWKAGFLEQRPDIRGIIDDNPEIMRAFSQNYKGVIFLFGNHPGTSSDMPRAKNCPTWPDVVREVSSEAQHYMV